jgi:hypothetical protein
MRALTQNKLLIVEGERGAKATLEFLHMTLRGALSRYWYVEGGLPPPYARVHVAFGFCNEEYRVIIPGMIKSVTTAKLFNLCAGSLQVSYKIQGVTDCLLPGSVHVN